jgi:hypothetical protein
VVTRYDRVAGHPLAGVPRELLETIYRALGDWPEVAELPDNDIVSIGDAVAANLNVRGYLAWPTRVPDRESLVLAVVQLQDDYRRFQDDEDVSFAERVVDAVVLPLLNVTVTGTVTSAGSVPTDQRPATEERDERTDRRGGDRRARAGGNGSRRSRDADVRAGTTETS